MKLRWAFLIIIAVILATGSTAFAKEYTGNFQIEQDGKLIGAEKFTVIFKQDGSVTTTSQGTIKQDDTNTETYSEVTYRTGKVIKDYQREVYVNKVPSKLVVVNQGNQLLIQIATGVHNQEKTISTHSHSIILDVGVFHHYHVLLDRYGMGAKGKQTFWAAIPSEAREAKVVVEFIEHGTVKVDEGYFEGDKYFINQGDIGVVVWMDERGKIFKIEIPMQGLEIKLKGYKGKRTANITEGTVTVNPFVKEEISFLSKDKTKLGGNITRPLKYEGKLPTIIFVSTAGPQDRDGMNVIGNIPTYTGKILDRLTMEGYMVLRFDDRGIGESGGDFARNALSRQREDIQAALNYLNTRSDVDLLRIAVIGHGEGANALMQFAADRTDIKAYVLMAPSSISLTQLAIRQVKTRLKSEGNSDPDAYTTSPIYRVINISREQTEKEFIIIGQRPVYLAIYRQWDAMDPVSDIGKIKSSVLHLQGGNDQQIFPDLAKALVNAPKSGKYTYKIFDGLDHFFVKSEGSPGAYADPTRKIDDKFLDYLVKWLGANL